MGTRTFTILLLLLFTCAHASLRAWTKTFLSLPWQEQIDLVQAWQSFPVIYDETIRQTTKGRHAEVSLQALKSYVMNPTPFIAQCSDALGTIGKLYDHLTQLPVVDHADAARLVYALYDFFDLIHARLTTSGDSEEYEFIAHLQCAAAYTHDLVTERKRAAHPDEHSTLWYMVLTQLCDSSRSPSYIVLKTTKFIPGLESLITGGVGQILQGVGSALPHIIGPLVTLATAGFAFYQFKYAINGPQKARRKRLEHMHKREMKRIRRELDEVASEATEFQKIFHQHAQALRDQLHAIKQTNTHIAATIEQNIAPQSAHALETIRRIRTRNDDTYAQMTNIHAFIEQKMLQHKCRNTQGQP